MTDLWHPTINGTVRMVEQINRQLEAMGHQVVVIGPRQFETMPFPGDPEVIVALHPEKTIGPMMLAARPDAIHLWTAGPIGIAARNILGSRHIPFTSSYVTKVPEYPALCIKHTKRPGDPCCPTRYPPSFRQEGQSMTDYVLTGLVKRRAELTG